MRLKRIFALAIKLDIINFTLLVMDISKEAWSYKQNNIQMENYFLLNNCTMYGIIKKIKTSSFKYTWIVVMLEKWLCVYKKIVKFLKTK